MQEVWKTIPDYNGRYQVSNTGKVRSFFKHPEGYELKQSVHKDGYRLLTLAKNNKDKSYHIHKLVTEAFYGPCPEGLVVRHIDGNPANNNLWNLAYGTPSQNNQDALKHGTIKVGEDAANAKLTEEQAMTIKALCYFGVSQRYLARAYEVNKSAIGHLHKGRTWKHLQLIAA